MPFYDYKCSKCNTTFEVLQSMTDDYITKCSNCNAKDTVQRVISSSVGISFKGSGFYITDSKAVKSESSD